MLIETGADIHARDNIGWILLHHLASTFRDMVRRASDAAKQRRFFIATEESMLLCLGLLVRIGTDPGVAEQEGKKPMDHFFPVTSDCKECLRDELAAFFGFVEGV